MKLSITWGAERNIMHIEQRAWHKSEMLMAAANLEAACDARCKKLGVGVLVLEIGVTLPMQSLIDNYLSYSAFRAVAIPRDRATDPTVDHHLIYKRFGWDNG